MVKDKEDTRTLQQLAQEVIDVQDAGNLRALAPAYGRAITRLQALLDLDTEALCEHPINRMWVSKLDSLAGYPNNLIGLLYSKLLDDCAKLAEVQK